MGKLIIAAVLIVGGAVAYYLWSQVPDTPKEQTLTGYTQGLKHSEEKAQAVASTANVEIVQDAINKYRAMKGTNPANLQELVPEYIDHIPGGVTYDPATGNASAVQ
jgi:hypothetical protein